MNDVKASKPRILVADDEPGIVELYCRILGPGSPHCGLVGGVAGQAVCASAENRSSELLLGFEVVAARQGEEALELARQALAEDRPFWVAFLDVQMPPGLDGVSTAERLRELDPNVHVVIVTGYTSTDPAEIAARVPPADKLLYLQKPFSMHEVRQFARALTTKWHIERALQQVNANLEGLVAERTADLALVNQQLEKEIVERRKAEKHLRYAAYHDALTGLPNRSLLTEHLTRSLERMHRQPGYRFAVLLLDIDNFKVINDSLGHAFGDQVLVATAERLQSSLRAIDAVGRGAANTTARLGGDEFVVLLDAIQHVTDTVAVAERIRERLSQPLNIDGHQVSLTISLGVALSDENTTHAGALLREADTALYRAKQCGKARYVLFDSDMHAAVTERLELEQALRQAFEQRQFGVAYQPIIEVETGRLTAFEALLRWTHPGRGNVSPAEFVPVTEEIGLVVPLGLWVLQEACRQLCLMNAILPPERQISINVNVSKRQLIETEFIADVDRVLREENVPFNRVNIEITESSVIEAGEFMDRQLRELRTLGVNLHMDDFGTGYSSLSCLHEFPLDVLKIDRSFIATMETNPKYSAIVQAIVSLARELNMRVTAEGVESAGHLAQITELGCDYAQGYYFAQPLPPDAAMELLERGATWLEPAVLH